MKKLKLLKIVFDQEIPSRSISQFRGAIISKISKDFILFHNHIGNDGYRYNYPLIQYKSINKKAALICIEDGTEEIHELLKLNNWNIEIKSGSLKLSIDQLSANHFTIQVWDKMFNYQISDWLGLNTVNYKKYNSIDGIVEKTQFLEKILIGNMLSFAKGIGYQVDKEIKLSITEITRTKLIRYKDASLQAFDLTFKCNFFIPNYIGLGKGASSGFGVVRENRIDGNRR